MIFLDKTCIHHRSCGRGAAYGRDGPVLACRAARGGPGRSVTGQEHCDLVSGVGRKNWKLLLIVKTSLRWSLYFQNGIVNFQSLHPVRKLMTDSINQQR